MSFRVFTRVRVHVGPTVVAQAAEKLAAAGFMDIIEGTAHVHGSIRWECIEGGDESVRMLIDKALGWSTGLGEISVIEQRHET